MNRTKIPQTDSIEELARFWDTHDLTDFADELEEVNESVFERQTEVTIRLEPQMLPLLQNWLSPGAFLKRI